MYKFHTLLTISIVSILFVSFACAGTEKAPEPAIQITKARTVVQKDWELQWENVLTLAKKERRVSVFSSLRPDTRDAIIRAVKEKFGIEAEVLSEGSSRLPKLLTERRVGLYLWDISLHGANDGINILKPAGALDPAEPSLILPEVKDPKAWLDGTFPWFDRDRTMIPFFARLDTYLSINTDLVKQGEITSYRDLLEPKWKGKILLRDPTTVGTGSGWFRENGKSLGLDYMKALVKQEPMILGNNRLIAEWLARGKYSILIAGDDTVIEFMEMRAPVAILDAKDSRSLSPSSGIVSLINRAPHPYAARLFLNWLLTREGQTIMTKTRGFPSRRLDAPTEHILPVLIPQPGKKYIEYTEESAAGGDEAIRISKEIFGTLLAR